MGLFDLDSVKQAPVMVEQVFDASAKELWEAITQLDQMKQWFFPNIPSFEPLVGFKIDFLVQSNERSFTHIWKIIEAVPNRRIKYQWSYTEYEGVGIVTFELERTKDQTLLRLTNEGLESFPKDIPEFTRESCESGWNYFIRNSLKEYLEQNK